jgi:putative ABC transport system permease protein
MIGQTGAVVELSLRSLPQRLWNSLVIVIGIAGVVGVLVSMLSMAAGLTDSVERAGRPDRAMVLRDGSNVEAGSSLSRDNVLVIADAPGVQHDAEGRALASPEAMEIVERPMRDGGDGNVTLRGIGPVALLVRPEIHLVAGRWFSPGMHELVVGRAAQRQFQDTAIGDRIVTTGGNTWTVVGLFESGGDTRESEMLADADTLMSAYARNVYQSVSVLLDRPQSFDAFKAALTSNPQLNVGPVTETEYLASQSKDLTKAMRTVARVIGAVMAVGAIFGALNTMYSAVSARMREIATLRAVGFGAMPIVVSVLIEAVVLALLGGILGAAIAWLLFNGHETNTLGSGFTQLVFRLEVTPILVGEGIAAACVIGLLGGLLPALKAARLPVATALRAL